MLKRAREEITQLPCLDACTLSIARGDLYSLTDTLSYLTKLYRKRKHELRTWRTSLCKGVQVGSLRYGLLNKDEDRAIVMMTGCYSPILALWTDRESRCTRFDIALDVHTTEKYPSFIKQLERKSMEGIHVGGKRLYSSVIRSVEGGFTIYVGKRGKTSMLRVYDKGAEMGKATGTHWRYEIEYGRNAATEKRKQFISAENGSAWIIDSVYDYCDRHSIPLPRVYNNPSQVVLASTVDCKDVDDASSLRFFFSVVVPFCKKMRQRYSVEWLADNLSIPDSIEFDVVKSDSLRYPVSKRPPLSAVDSLGGFREFVSKCCDGAGFREANLNEVLLKLVY